MIATIAMAADVITKKNGTTIQCKVMKVGRTEVEYKNITNLDGPVYALDLTEISSITYENGAVDKFGEQSVVTTNAGQRTMTDGELLAMYKQENRMQPYQVWKMSGAILGGLGAASLTCGIIFNVWYRYGEIGIGPVLAYYAGGAACFAGGYLCYRKGYNMQKQVQPRYSCAPIFEQDFQLGNNTMLSADVNMINDNLTHDKSLGLGLRFTF